MSRRPASASKVDHQRVEKSPSSQRAYVVGVVLLLAAGLLWSLNGALIKLTFREGEGPHPVVIAFYRSLFAGLFLLPLIRGRLHTLHRTHGRSGAGESPRPTGVSLLALRPASILCVVFFTLMTVCFVVANTMTEAANAIILQYTSTFWVFGLSPVLLGERPRRGDLWILALAMAGIGIIFAGNASADLVGLVIALGSGLFFALLTLMIRIMRDSDSAAVTVVNNLGSALLLLPAAWLIGGLMVTGREWVLLVLLGVVQFGLPYYLYSLGLARVPAYQAALLTMAEPVLVPIWTYLAVGEPVPYPTVGGGGLILIALLLFIRAAGRGTPDFAKEASRS